ncbi:MAG: GNAT family N-acetyltransferase [Candidatus Limnocylindria bacterium]
MKYPRSDLGSDILHLREWRLADAEAIRDAFADPAIRQSIPDLPESPSVRDGGSYIRHARAQTDAGTAIYLAIASREDDAAIGSVTFHITSDRHWFVGYWLTPAWRGRGITTAALRLAARWAFSTFEPLMRISLFTRPDNTISQRVAVGAGFLEEGVLRRWHESGGVLKDVVMFSLIRDDVAINQG